LSLIKSSVTLKITSSFVLVGKGWQSRILSWTSAFI
jgi:hypothetical protein